MDPKVSIIVPVYNAEVYLPRCIDSLLGQTYPNLELILIDDQSPDGSGRICDEYAARDQRVKVIHKTNGGISDARNKGLDAATGDYIAFCDNDDFYSPYYLETMVAMCRETGSDIAHCRCRRGLEDGFNDPRPDFPIHTLPASEALRDFYRTCTTYVWDKLFHRDIFKTLRFPFGTYIGEDCYVVPRALHLARQVAFTPAVMYYHYTNPLSVTQRRFTLRNMEDLDTIEDRLDFARKNGLTELYHHTLCRYFCNLKYYRTMCRKYIKGSTAIRRELRVKQNKAYKEIMSSEIIDSKLKAFIRTGQHAPFIYDLYNHLKFNLRGHRMRWGEYYMVI